MQPADWDWLQGEVTAAAGRFAGQLRIAGDPHAKVPNLEWSVAELGRHLASLPQLYRAQHEVGPEFTPPSDWRTFSASARNHLVTDDLDEIAHLVEQESATLLTASDPDERRWLYGCATTIGNTAAGLLTELILHGRDLGGLTGERPELGRRQALAGLEQQLALTPAFIDPVKAAPLAGVYGLRFRGGPEVTYRVDDRGALTVERGRPQRADARLLADPVAFVMSSLGRANPAVVVLTGGVIAYGRRPWRLVRLGRAVVDGV